MEKRKTSLDLLKIVCILMIITLHYFNNRIGKGFYSVNIYFGAFKFFMESLAICASNVFVIIYGYNSIKKKRNIKSVIISSLKILSLVLVYSIAVALISMITNGSNNPFDVFVNNSIDILWFPKHFILLILLSPLLNYIVSKLDKKKYILLLLLLTILISFISLFIYDFLFIKGGYNIQTFILLYLIGGYLKLYIKKNSIIFNIIIYLICAFVIFILFGFKIDWALYYNNIFVIIESIALFNIFNNINIKENKLITEISTYSLAIYIIHTSEIIRPILFISIFKSNIYCKDINFIWNYPLTIIGIFIICFIIEYIRRLIVKLIKKGTTRK